MSQVRVRLAKIEKLTDEEDKFHELGEFQFDAIPLNSGPFSIDGEVMVPVLGVWEINTQTRETRLFIRVMNQEHAATAQRTLALMQGAGQGAPPGMRMGASGPVLDLNNVRRNS